jgi:UDP-N-acetylmuramoylalanine--D-glutamate ligase
VELEGKSAVVVGMARSGVAAAEFLLRRGARVVATDRKPAAELPPEVTRLGEKGARLALGGHDASTFTGADLVVVSPGVPWDLPELVASRRAGVEVMAELELGYRCLSGTVAAITGTKGKSTTTAALGAMLKEAGQDVRVGGNIGEAVTGLVEGSTDKTVFVLEVSSFQLEGTEAFHPRVAVFLNLSPDHLDRHPSFEDYARAKARIFRNQTEEDWAVVNADDPGVLALAREGRASRLPFHPLPSPSPPRERGAPAAFFAGDQARLRGGGSEETLFPLSAVRLPGTHLAGDLLAAGAAARLLGATAEAVESAVRRFTGVEHVLERVAEISGVAFFNDSKATNVDAACKSVEAFPGPLLVVMGGRYKGGDFHDLSGALSARGKVVLAIGEAKGRISEALGSVLPVIACASLAEAVERAWAQAEPGDTVLLAPACSSFDMFPDYAARGRAFKEEVRRLERREREARG